MKTVKVGYTSGVFDMFHVGHLNILRRAKEMCDFLIVGVSSDDLVFDLKHKRPIIPEQDRMAIVEAIRYVDQVVVETDRDKRVTWDALKFDCLFKGDDWKADPRMQAEAEYLRNHGVAIHFFPYTRGVSSSQLRNSLNTNKLGGVN